MKNPIPRILLALASTDAGERDLLEFLRWIDLNGLHHAVEIIHSLQTASTSANREFGRGLSEKSSFISTKEISEKQLVARIERLMLESGLTKSATIKATTSLLKERGYATKSSQNVSKISFRSWIEQLIRQVPPDILLSIASAVRNHSAHGIDWPLRRDKP